MQVLVLFSGFTIEEKANRDTISLAMLLLNRNREDLL